MKNKIWKTIFGAGAVSVTAAMTLSALTLSACAEGIIDSDNLDIHKIGVVVYSLQDEQVMAFRDYLENYIAGCFPDVQFLYSNSVNDAEAEMAFLKAAVDEGVEGVLSFSSYDLPGEVQFLSDNGVYYMRAASSENEDVLKQVEDNPYFLGCVGPGVDMEYAAGFDMGKHFAETKEDDAYFILSGGAPFGVQMHAIRTQGILDALAESYGVNLKDTLTLAASFEPTVVTEGDLTVCVVPGFLDNEGFAETAKNAYAENAYKQVLSVVPISLLADTVKDARLGVIDCYSVQNLQLFNQGTLDYVTGKFSSTIGPSFALMYNAVTGYAEEFREDGKAISLTQGFWTSDSQEDYADKYTLSSSIALNAYSAEDLAGVCMRFNPDATLEELKNLAQAYTYEDALERRGLN